MRKRDKSSQIETVSCKAYTAANVESLVLLLASLSKAIYSDLTLSRTTGIQDLLSTPDLTGSQIVRNLGDRLLAEHCHSGLVILGSVGKKKRRKRENKINFLIKAKSY